MELSTGQTVLGEREYEVWADDSYPPYILMVLRDEGEPPTFKIINPLEQNKVRFSSNNYDEIVWWLNEDEFSRVEGRTKILEWWEQPTHIRSIEMAKAEPKVQDAEQSNGKLVQYHAGEGIALLTLNDPPANTYSYEMMQELDRAILAARMDEAVHVIVITGQGEKFFCAGADIAMLNNVTPTFKYYFCLHANETLSRLEQTPKLVIAAINGHCVGGGLEVAMAADLRIARRNAGKMGLPEVSLGVLPGTGGTQRLVRIVGKSRAIELMATGELFAFDKAHELGLINNIYDADNGASFSEQVMAYAQQFTPPNKAAHAVGRIKRAVQTGAEIPFESALALERELQQQLFQSEDAREGLDAYANKRQAQFKGR